MLIWKMNPCDVIKGKFLLIYTPKCAVMMGGVLLSHKCVSEISNGEVCTILFYKSPFISLTEVGVLAIFVINNTCVLTLTHM